MVQLQIHQRFSSPAPVFLAQILFVFLASPSINISLLSHVTKIVQSCKYHIRGLRHIRELISKDMANTLSCSIVGCRLDYCNALLYGMSQKNLNSLQRIQKSLARVVCNAPYRCSAQPLLKSLHWLPIIERVEYKLAPTPL
jgi:hypothetical protein